MGLMDAIMADSKVELKVNELYSILKVAAENKQTASFLLNGVKNEVPYKYIREIITGESELIQEDETEVSEIGFKSPNAKSSKKPQVKK
nr:MAG TPA: hypothetical protein [Caudoviricetes sp.]